MQFKKPSALGSRKLWQICAWLLIINGWAGVLVPLSATLMGGSAIDPMGLLAMTPLMGIAAGFIALRGYLAGLVIGVVFYAIQTINFFSPAVTFNFKSGLSIATVFVLPQGVLVINWAALVLAILCVVVVWCKPRHQDSYKGV
jgi:hypothetical protein